MVAGKRLAGKQSKKRKFRAFLRKARKAFWKWLTKKREFSKIFCTVAALGIFRLGVWLLQEYYRLLELAIETGSMTAPDPSIPITGLTMIVAPVVSYLLYQLGLKNSRNKYGVDADGQPFNRVNGLDAPDTPEHTDGTVG